MGPSGTPGGPFPFGEQVLNTLPDEPEHLDDEAPEAVEIAKFAKPRGRPPGSTKKIEIRLIRGYWPHSGIGKVQRGEVISVDKDEARAILACGIGELADPLGD